jgi:hypothetical protein
MTIMTKNAKEYGLDEVIPEAPLEYDTVRMTADTNLELIGDMTETAISQLLQLNPALIKNVAPDGYSVRVPKGSGETLQSSLETVAPGQRASWRMHHVIEGDTLGTIAKRYGASAKSITDANPMIAGLPTPGDRLLIPSVHHATVSRPATRTTYAKRSSPRPAARTVASSAILAQSHKSKIAAR